MSTACGSDRPPRWSSSSTSSKDAESDRARRDDREQPVEVSGDQVGVQQCLAGPHPVAVAHDGVDLAVVRDEAERVGERPARERVRREPRVHQGDRGLHPLVDQVREEVVELLGGEHALVGDRAAGQRREVGIGLLLRTLAQAERQPLQAHPEEPAAGRRDEQLAEGRHHRQRGGAEAGGVGGHLAPAQDREALLRGELLDPAAGLRDRLVVTRDERGADGVCVAPGELEVDDLTEEPVRDLEQDARAVAGVGLGARGSAVLEVAQCGERLVDDLVAGHPAQGRPRRRRRTHRARAARRTAPGAAGTPACALSRRRRARPSRGRAAWSERAGTTLAHAESSAYRRGDLPLPSAGRDGPHNM